MRGGQSMTRQQTAGGDRVPGDGAVFQFKSGDVLDRRQRENDFNAQAGPFS